jgi:hypothetical protein
VFVDHQWIVVPDGAVVKDPNRDGSAVVMDHGCSHRDSRWGAYRDTLLFPSSREKRSKCQRHGETKKSKNVMHVTDRDADEGTLRDS